jgi:integrating conjugative element protein (TIGR03765 family)
MKTTIARHRQRLCFLGVLLLPALVAAELTVIHDSGDTRPLAPLLEALGAKVPSGGKRADAYYPNLGAANIERLLPIRSPGLTAGKAVPRPVEQRFARPFFLIGADPVSREWLAKNRAKLVRIGAVGMLVQAETADDLRSIAELANGLPILPAPATDIAAALGLSHYPVLISSEGIAQ